MANKGEREFSQSVDNALRLLGCFADREECGISELSRELGISKASVARIVAALERGRFLSRNPDTGRYRLGVGRCFSARWCGSGASWRGPCPPSCTP